MKLNNLNDNLIYNSIKEVEKAEEVPAGYVEIKLSTKGLVGAPANFHIRNFKVGEILDLALSSEEELPARLINILNQMIYEDIDVNNFHEKEVEELMLYIYASFYSDTFEDVTFPLIKEDFDFLFKNNPELIEDINEKRYVPKTTISISQGVDVYDIPENFKKDITISNKETGFFVTFGIVKYSDRLLVKRWLDKFYENETAKFQHIADELSKKHPVSEEDEAAYNEFLSRKFNTLAEMSRIVSIKNYNGMDVENLSLSDKYKLMASDARIDFGLISKLIERQNKMKFGIKPFVKMQNPLTYQMCERRFSFRIPSLLQAMQVFGSDKYDDGYDDEDGTSMEGSL